MLSFSDEDKKLYYFGRWRCFYFWQYILLLVETLAPSSCPTDSRLTGWIYTTIFDMLFFLRCYFFESNEKMETFDIVLKKIHRPSVNRFDGAIFLAISGVNYPPGGVGGYLPCLHMGVCVPCFWVWNFTWKPYFWVQNFQTWMSHFWGVRIFSNCHFLSV